MGNVESKSGFRTAILELRSKEKVSLSTSFERDIPCNIPKHFAHCSNLSVLLMHRSSSRKMICSGSSFGRIKASIFRKFLPWSHRRIFVPFARIPRGTLLLWHSSVLMKSASVWKHPALLRPNSRMVRSARRSSDAVTLSPVCPLA